MGAQIVVKIAPDGKVTSEVFGVKGAACTDLTKFLDKLGKVTDDQHTPDFYEQADQQIGVGG